MMRKWYILWICALTSFLSSCMPVNYMTPDYIVSEMPPDTALTVLEKCLPKMYGLPYRIYTDIGVYRDRFKYTEYLDLRMPGHSGFKSSCIISYSDITKVKIRHILLPISRYEVAIYTGNFVPKCLLRFKDKEDAKAVCDALTVLRMRRN